MATSFTIRPSGQGSNTTVTNIGNMYTVSFSGSAGAKSPLTASYPEWVAARDHPAGVYSNDKVVYVGPDSKLFDNLLGENLSGEGNSGNAFTYLTGSNYNFTNDQVVEYVYKNRGTSFWYMGGMLRFSIGQPGNESGSGYMYYSNARGGTTSGAPSDTLNVVRLDNGTPTSLVFQISASTRKSVWNQSTTSPAQLREAGIPHGRIRFQITGSTLAIIDGETGKVIWSTTDSTYQSGSVGLCVQRSNTPNQGWHSFSAWDYSPLANSGWENNNVSRRPVTLKPSS
jgi:hypothetical protein